MDEAAGHTSSKRAAERPGTEERWKGTSELAENKPRKGPRELRKGTEKLAGSTYTSPPAGNTLESIQELQEYQPELVEALLQT